MTMKNLKSYAERMANMTPAQLDRTDNGYCKMCGEDPDAEFDLHDPGELKPPLPFCSKECLDAALNVFTDVTHEEADKIENAIKNVIDSDKTIQ